MQVDETLAGAGGRAVGEHERPLEAAHSDAQNAGRVAGEFDDGVPAAQRSVDREDDALQQGIPASPPRRPHELHSSRPQHWIRQAALPRSYNPLISCGFQPVA